MFEVLRKLDDGQEVLACKMVNEINVDKDIEGKELGENEIEMVGSTSGVDRDGESIDISAWDIKAFKKNPVILPQHDYKKPAIGKAKSVKITDGKLTFKIEFPEEGINPEADVYRKLYKAGFMNASSVGFIPKEWVDGDGKKTPFRKFTKVELLELSLVSVPANPEALMSAKSKGIVSNEELKTIGIELEEVEVKSDDPNLMINDEHMKLHKEMSEFVNTANLRLTYLEGFISGISKSEKEQKQENNVTLKYISDILGGEPEAKSTDEASTEQEVSLSDTLKAKSLKQFLKGE